MADPPAPDPRQAGLSGLLERFAALSRRSVEISAARSAEECFATLEKILVDPLGLDLYQVYEIDADGKSRWRAGRRPEEAGTADEVLVRWALRNPRPILVPWEKGPVSGRDVRSQILMPIVTHDRPYGMVLAWVPFEEGESSDLLLGALQTLSRVVAFTIENLLAAKRNRELRDLLDSILESVPHAILAIDREDRIVACNRNLEFLVGVSRGDILQRTCREALPQELAQVLGTLTLETLQGNEAVDFEHEHKVDEKSTLHVGITSSLLMEGDRPAGVLFILRDLSLSREVQKLRELDEMKSAFVHTVSHELKTPLTAVLGGTELLMAQRDVLNEEQRMLVEMVDTGGRRLHELISDLLDVSRLESGRVRLEPTSVNLPAMVQEVAALVQHRNPKCTIRFDFADPFPDVMADRAKIRQVVENFMSNAFKYSPNGGEVVARLWTEGGEARFEVTDCGIGIPEKDLPFIWDKFYRVESARMAQIEGTGLGLAIVKHIVEMHGGKVWARSSEGKGSTFGFGLP